MGSNVDYWADRQGNDYKAQQDIRRSSNNPSYAHQEAWLTSYIKALHVSKGEQRLRILDFGCGFGRFAHILASLKFVDYFGFDSSASMVAPLHTHPPLAIKNIINERVRVSEDFEAVFPASEKFDLIFSVSVLIHNQPVAAKKIVVAMMDRVKSDGTIVLIENPLTAVSTMENLWHGGCWCHAFPRYFEGLADSEIIDWFADRHGVYILTPFSSDRPSKYSYRRSSHGESQIYNLNEILSIGLSHAEDIEGRMMKEIDFIANLDGKIVGDLRDTSEELENVKIELDESRKTGIEHERVIDALRSENLSLNVDYNNLLDSYSELTSRFASRLKLIESVSDGLTRSKNRRPYENVAPDDEGGHRIEAVRHVYEIGSNQDTRYAQKIPGFEGVLHIFHMEWVGIRAAVGSLPGVKLSIPADRVLSSQVISEICLKIAHAQYDRIVAHGFSNNMSSLVSALSSMGLASILYIVKHGNPAQWCYDSERRASFDVIDLVATKRVRRAHFMKAGFDVGIPDIFRPMLFNLAPNFSAGKALDLPATERSVVFAPAWADWRKNLYTNLIAACLVDAVDKVIIHADNIELPNSIKNKIVRHKFINREQTFDLISHSSICLNASIVDCHPMVNVEAQALGVACIRGRLNLDALEEHPYVKLTEVDNVMSIVDIRQVLERALSVPADEMRAITLDYQEASDAISRNRYREFLEL